MSNSPWTSYSLWPDDVLFFRDGKPSTVGDDHYLRSLFPPNPSTLYGAIRTRRLIDEGIALASLKGEKSWARLGPLREELGDWGGFGNLEIRGPWFVRRLDGDPSKTTACREELLVPAPADLALLTEPPEREASLRRQTTAPSPPNISEVLRYRHAKLGKKGTSHISHPLGLWHPYRRTGAGWQEYRPKLGETAAESASGWYLQPDGIRDWVAGRLPERKNFVHRSELWIDEYRTGVGLQPDQRSHVDGQLFTFGFVRLRQRVGLGFEARGTPLKPRGYLRLGGDGKTATLAAGPPFPTLSHNKESAPSTPFCLAFATPALSERGAYPPTLGKSRPTPPALRGALVHGSLPIGGWDVANRRSKPLRRALAPGSLYLLAPAAGETALTAAQLHGRNLSDFPHEHLARQGFGLALTGSYPWEDS